MELSEARSLHEAVVKNPPEDITRTVELVRLDVVEDMNKLQAAHIVLIEDLRKRVAALEKKDKGLKGP